MDSLSLRFAEESALRQIDECTDLHELKQLTRSLVKGHFQARGFIGELMRQQLIQLAAQELKP